MHSENMNGKTMQYDLLDLMRRTCQVSNSALDPKYVHQLARALSKPDSELISKSVNSDALLQLLISLAVKRTSFSVDRDFATSPIDLQIQECLRRLAHYLPTLPNCDSAAVACLDDYILSHIEIVAPNLLSLMAKKLEIPDSLHLVDWVMDRFCSSIDLSDCFLIASQHLLGSSIPVFNALAQLGLPYEHMFIVGKAYSAHRLIVWELQRKGAWVHPGCLEYRGEVSSQRPVEYQEQLGKDVRDAFSKMVDDLARRSTFTWKRSRIIILDDGGKAIETALSLLNTEKIFSAEQFVGVEQTRKGIRQLENLSNHGELPFPAVNVAESKSKLELETPLIGDSVVELTMQRLQRQVRGITLDGATVFVIGFGSVGKAVAKACQKMNASRVLAYDPEKVRLAEAIKEGFDTTLGLIEALKKCDLIFGCTGRSCIPENAINAINPEAVMASASTSNTEFLNVYGRMQSAEDMRVETFLPVMCRQVHNDHLLMCRGKTIRVLNAGFPINFDGSVDPIVPSQIQLTRALMLAGIINSIEQQKQKGLIALDNKYDTAISQEFRRMLLSGESADLIK